MPEGWYNIFMEQFILGNLWMIPVMLALAVWSLIWKGLALWKAARAGSAYWFAALLLINTLGILEILYIYIFSKKPEQQS